MSTASALGWTYCWHCERNYVQRLGDLCAFCKGWLSSRGFSRLPDDWRRGRFREELESDLGAPALHRPRGVHYTRRAIEVSTAQSALSKLYLPPSVIRE